MIGKIVHNDVFTITWEQKWADTAIRPCGRLHQLVVKYISTSIYKQLKRFTFLWFENLWMNYDSIDVYWVNPHCCQHCNTACQVKTFDKQWLHPYVTIMHWINGTIYWTWPLFQHLLGIPPTISAETFQGERKPTKHEREKCSLYYLQIGHTDVALWDVLVSFRWARHRKVPG